MRGKMWFLSVAGFVAGMGALVWAGNGADASNPENAGEIAATLTCNGEGLNQALVYIPGVSPVVKLGPSGYFRLRHVDPGVHSLTVEQDGNVVATFNGIAVDKKRVADLGELQVCPDLDGDGFDQSEDCDDMNASIFPNATEECDGVDNNCDGQVDESGCTTCTDADDDSHYAQEGCGSPIDCDDGNAAIHPGAGETCDGFDNDCDGVVDEGFDLDGDTFTSCGGDCNDSDAYANPAAPEVCDGVDNDCDASVDELPECFFECSPFEERSCGSSVGACQSGVQTCSADGVWGECAGEVPPSEEICSNGVDDDCDGQTDEGVDGDGDGVTNCDGDCNDLDPTVNPNASELCDGLDNDCDGELDEDFDLSKDNYSCGACGVVCTSRTRCVSGACEPCSSDEDGCMP